MQRELRPLRTAIVGIHFCDSVLLARDKLPQQFLRLSPELIEVWMLAQYARR
jgi:hypothetical protein